MLLQKTPRMVIERAFATTLGLTLGELSRLYDNEESLSPCPVRDQLIGSSAAFVNTEVRISSGNCKSGCSVPSRPLIS